MYKTRQTRLVAEQEKIISVTRDDLIKVKAELVTASAKIDRFKTQKDDLKKDKDGGTKIDNESWWN